MVNSVCPDQTDSLGAARSESALIAETALSQYLQNFQGNAIDILA